MENSNLSFSSQLPSYDEFYLALLEVAKDFGSKDFSRKDAYPIMARKLNLTEEQKNLRYMVTGDSVWKTRAAWRFTGLIHCGALCRVRRGFYRITPKGGELLEQARRNPQFSIVKFIDELDNTRQKESNSDKEKKILFSQEIPTEDRIGEIYDEAQATLSNEILERLKSGSPSFFEHAVIRLLVAMGYGDSSVPDYAKVTGKSGDGGIDGIIQEDKLGLGFIYVQAKRHTEGTIGRPMIQQFAGALPGKNGCKGVFITTSKFSKEAVEFAKHSPAHIVLIDGNKLANLMFMYNVGVTVKKVFEVKRIDVDFFEDA